MKQELGDIVRHLRKVFTQVAPEQLAHCTADNLALLSHSVQRFQDDALGKAGPRPSSMVRIPSRTFMDLSVGSAHCELLKKLIRAGRGQPAVWLDPAATAANTAALVAAKKACQSQGLLRNPVIKFAASVPVDLRGELAQVARSLGATVLGRPAAGAAPPPAPTHIVDFEEGVDWVRSDEAPSREEETEYVRLLLKNPDRSRALVHWWYYPPSYDEWLPATDVDGVSQEPARDTGDGAPASRVNCRFVRDAAYWNEWGYEPDYEIDDGAEKEAEEPEAVSPAPRPVAPKYASSKKKGKKRQKPDRLLLEGLECPPPVHDLSSASVTFVSINTRESHVVPTRGVPQKAPKGSKRRRLSPTKAEEGVKDPAEAQDTAPLAGPHDAPDKASAPDEAQSAAAPLVNPLATWYREGAVSDVERLVLAGLLGGAVTEEEYLRTRRTLVERSAACLRSSGAAAKAPADQKGSGGGAAPGSRPGWLSFTEARRGLPMAAQHLRRIYDFLCRFGIINFGVESLERLLVAPRVLGADGRPLSALATGALNDLILADKRVRDMLEARAGPCASAPPSAARARAEPFTAEMRGAMLKLLAERVELRVGGDGILLANPDGLWDAAADAARAAAPPSADGGAVDAVTALLEFLRLPMDALLDAFRPLFGEGAAGGAADASAAPREEAFGAAADALDLLERQGRGGEVAAIASALAALPGSEEEKMEAATLAALLRYTEDAAEQEERRAGLAVSEILDLHIGLLEDKMAVYRGPRDAVVGVADALARQRRSMQVYQQSRLSGAH